MSVAAGILFLAVASAYMLSTRYEKSDLFEAARKGDPIEIRRLLNSEHNLNLYPNGLSTVGPAIRSGDFESFQLLANRYSLETMEREDWLQMAISAHNDKVFEYCLECQRYYGSLIHPVFNSIYARNAFALNRSLHNGFNESIRGARGESLDEALRRSGWKPGRDIVARWRKERPELNRQDNRRYDAISFRHRSEPAQYVTPSQSLRVPVGKEL